MASSPTTDPIDALLPQANGTSPLRDMADALHGRLGVALAVGAGVVVLWSVQRTVRARRRRTPVRARLVSSTASRGFGLYQCAAYAPGRDVRALTPSWPADPALADLPSPFAPPAADDVQPPPWATWVRAPR